MVRVPHRREAGGGAEPKDWIKAMSAVADAFSDKSTTTRAILCMAQGHKFDDFRMDWESQNKKEGQDNEKLLSEAWISFRETMHGILAGIIEKGVFIATGAGNDGVIHALPAAFTSELTKDFDLSIPELLVMVATAYTAGLAAYFLKLHQLGRLGPDKKGNQPDMSPAGLKRYIINNGWVRQNEKNNGVLGIWNGATIESLEREGFCPYIAGTTNIFRLRRQEGAALTGSGSVTPTAMRTTFVCTEETVHKCAPGVVCSRPKVNGCVDGKCVCVLPDLPAPTSFVCTERTVDKCSPEVVCSAPQTNGCVDGKCVCVLPDLPSKTTAVQTTLSTVTSKPPDPVPTPIETPKTPVVIGERKCHDASIYTGKTDIWKSSVYDASLRACTECETPMKADSETRRRDDSWGGVRYDMSISWRSGCVSAPESINCANPTKNLTMLHNTACEELFQDNWEKCTGNQGRGGYIDVGCLRYDFTPK
ncbi:hypothetical protein Brms1b_009690 [Colletotrichum noveboracense]|nr:hypothetical protein Brms1b_009690 [Colletotrichum noveboracense]